VTGPELSFEDRRQKKTPGHLRDYAPLPSLCWRCAEKPAVKNHASCEDCLEFVTERAAEIRDWRRSAG
jgi:hypothetical protein